MSSLFFLTSGIPLSRGFFNKTAVPSRPSASIAAREVRLKRRTSLRLIFSLNRQRIVENVCNTTEQAFEEFLGSCAQVEASLEEMSEDKHETQLIIETVSL